MIRQHILRLPISELITCGKQPRFFGGNVSYLSHSLITSQLDRHVQVTGGNPVHVPIYLIGDTSTHLAGN